MPPLKVFVSDQGFYEAAVAVTSQAKALAAWGTRQNLFAEGAARITDDPATVKAAMAEPGRVVRRPLGGRGRFTPAETAARPAAGAGRPKRSGKPPPTRAKPKPRSRAALERAELALAELERNRQGEEAEFIKAAEALEHRQARARVAFEKERVRLADRVRREREKLAH